MEFSDRTGDRKNESLVCRHSVQSWTYGPDGMYCEDCDSIVVEGADRLWRRQSPSEERKEKTR